MKTLALLIFVLLSKASFAAPSIMSISVNSPALKQVDCSAALDKTTGEFLNQIIRNFSLSFSTLEGIVFKVNLQRNMFGIYTGEVSAKSTGQIYNNLPVYVCRESSAKNYFIMLYADRVSPVGTYRYEGFVFIPMNIRPNTNTLSLVNLRKGVFSSVIMRLDSSRIR